MPDTNISALHLTEPNIKAVAIRTDLYIKLDSNNMFCMFSQNKRHCKQTDKQKQKRWNNKSLCSREEKKYQEKKLKCLLVESANG